MPIKNLSAYFGNIPEDIKPLFDEAENLWEILAKLDSFLRHKAKSRMKGLKVGEVYIDQGVQIGEGTIVEHGAMIKGPTIIGENCTIRSGAYIRGGVYVGNKAIVGHATEIKNSILLEGAHASHLNYVGDSILGSGVNLGAGSILANLRFDEAKIKVGEISTFMSKFGSVLGDECQLGCNTVLNPGTILEKNIVYAGKPLKSGFYNWKDIQDIIANA